MDKRHFTMAGSLLLAMSLSACGGGSGTATLPGSVNTSAFGLPATVPVLSHRLSTPMIGQPTYIAIDAGSSAAVGTWGADADYAMSGSQGTRSVTAAINTSHVTNPPPQTVLQTQRYATRLTYTIPNIAAGSAYLVRLHFVESFFTAPKARVFNVAINGVTVATNFDIYQVAGGANIANVQQFTTTGAANGTITIALSASVNNASIAAIEVESAPNASPTPSPTPTATSTPGLESVLAINAGGTSSGAWLADIDYQNGAWSAVNSTTGAINTSKVASPAPQTVYQSQRFGPNFGYLIPNLTPGGAYTVRLHLVESFWTAVGKRVFNVAVNGTPFLTGFDIYKAAGGTNIAITQDFATRADSSGHVTIATSSTVDNASIAGVQILSGSGAAASPTPTPSSSPSATPTASPTSTPSSGAYPSAGWLPFSKGPLVTPVSAMYGSSPLTSCKLSGGFNGTCLASNSSAVIGNLWGNSPSTFNTMQMLLGGSSVFRQNYNGGGNTTTPYFQTTSAAPLYNVLLCGDYPGSCDTGSVHIPTGAVPEDGFDHHLYIRDLSEGVDWSFWISPIPSGTGGNFRPTGSGNVESLNASGEGIGLGGTAGNISLAWSERPEDVLAGRIPHALSLRVTCDATNDGQHGSYVYPVIPNDHGGATDNNFFCGTSAANGSSDQEYVAWSNSSVNLQYGAHLWLDESVPSAKRNTAGCDIIAYAELNALNEFGGYVNDVGSAQYFEAPIFVNRFADISDTYDGNPNGTVSQWAKVAAQIGEPSSPGSGWYYNVTNCGINLAQHLHVLIPPAVN